MCGILGPNRRQESIMNHLKTQIGDIIAKTITILKQEDLTEEDKLQALNNLRAALKLLNNV